MHRGYLMHPVMLSGRNLCREMVKTRYCVSAMPLGY